jgi:hypothetical protein
LFARFHWLIHPFEFRNPLDRFRNVPSPERDRSAERERSRIERLNMTSTDDCHTHNRSFAPPEGDPVPQPFFTNQSSTLQGAGGNTPLRYPMPAAPTMGGQYSQSGYFGPAPALPQGDVFSVGVGGPMRHTAPYVPMQSAAAGPSHRQPPQMIPQPRRDPWGIDQDRSMPPPMAPPQYPLQHPGFINLGDDVPQRQMQSASNAQPEITSHHRTLRPVRSDPAFNNIHRGHVAHREREALALNWAPLSMDGKSD